MNDDSPDVPAWQHAFRDQLNQAEGVPEAGAATLDPEAAGLLRGVPDAALHDACARAEPGGLEAQALAAEIARRGRSS